MKTFILIVYIISLCVFGFGQSEAAFCKNSGYCYNLENGQTGLSQNSFLASIFNPTDAPEVIFSSIFNFGLSFVGASALVMMVIEGIRYMTSAGDQSKTGESKRKIWNAVWGLILALISYILLQTINPDLVKPGLKTISLQKQQLQEPEFNQELNKCLYNKSSADCEKLKKKECAKQTSDQADPCYCVQNPGKGICIVTQ